MDSIAYRCVCGPDLLANHQTSGRHLVKPGSFRAPLDRLSLWLSAVYDYLGLSVQCLGWKGD